MKRDPRPPLKARENYSRAFWLAPVTVMAGSLLGACLPIVVTFPIVPPFGLLMLIAWRMRRPDVFRSWTPLPLGLFDDLFSGQPLGAAMLLWTVANLALDAVDSRLAWRDFWQDWLVATSVIGGVLIVGRLIATPLGTHVDTALLLQIATSAALYPLVVRAVAAFDPREARPA